MISTVWVLPSLPAKVAVAALGAMLKTPVAHLPPAPTPVELGCGTKISLVGNDEVRTPVFDGRPAAAASAIRRFAAASQQVTRYYAGARARRRCRNGSALETVALADFGVAT